MTLEIILALLASFLWAVTNHIDKYLLCSTENSTSNIKSLLIFSSLIAGLVLSPLWLVFNSFQVSITTISLIFVFVSAIIYLLATYFYFKALEKNDASIVVVMFQLIPVFSYVFSWLLFKETLTTNQMIGALIIISSAVIISLDFENKSNKNKLTALILMIISSLMYALYFILFDIAIRNSEYNAVAFWYQMSFLLIGIILLCIKSFRNPFIALLKSNGKKIMSLNITNEVLNLIANLMVNFANLTIPLALANTLNGFQGAFVFIIGAIGVLIFPKIFREDLSKKVVIQKIFSIIIGIIGLIIMVK